MEQTLTKAKDSPLGLHCIFDVGWKHFCSESSSSFERVHIVKSDSPVSRIGSPKRSNKSCSNGFFTSASTSQSLPSAGLIFT